jgi:hypothetical protein
MFNTRNKSGISAHPCIILYLSHSVNKSILIRVLKGLTFTADHKRQLPEKDKAKFDVSSEGPSVGKLEGPSLEMSNFSLYIFQVVASLPTKACPIIRQHELYT